jgi:hypothetical protein
LVLQYLHTTMTYQTLQQLYGLGFGTIARMRRNGMSALYEALLKIPAAKIEWPTVAQQRKYAEVIQQKHGKVCASSFVAYVWCGVSSFVWSRSCPVAMSGASSMA